MIRVIHIGKCGGSTVSTILRKYNIRHEHVHMKKPIFNDTHKYLIIIRNPIDRFISAFNWRYKLVVLDKTQETRFAGEKETLIKYTSVNTLAERIAEYDVQTSYIHHIAEDIHFYLGGFLKTCTKEKILGVVTQEDLDHDVYNIFAVRNNNVHQKNNTKTDKYISPLGRDLLKQYLYKDYECIDKLFALGCLTEKQYTILSK